jgi:hypothetical protein
MTVHAPILLVETGLRKASGLPPSRAIASLAKRIADWITTAADYYAASAMYEQLSRLSDAELERRGLSRANLGRDVCRACDPTGR